MVIFYFQFLFLLSPLFRIVPLIILYHLFAIIRQLKFIVIFSDLKMINVKNFHFIIIFNRYFINFPLNSNQFKKYFRKFKYLDLLAYLFIIMISFIILKIYYFISFLNLKYYQFIQIFILFI